MEFEGHDIRHDGGPGHNALGYDVNPFYDDDDDDDDDQRCRRGLCSVDAF